jgi:hypothetical protein
VLEDHDPCTAVQYRNSQLLSRIATISYRYRLFTLGTRHVLRVRHVHAQHDMYMFGVRGPDPSHPDPRWRAQVRCAPDPRPTATIPSVPAGVRHVRCVFKKGPRKNPHIFHYFPVVRTVLAQFSHSFSHDHNAQFSQSSQNSQKPQKSRSPR